MSILDSPSRVVTLSKKLGDLSSTLFGCSSKSFQIMILEGPSQSVLLFVQVKFAHAIFVLMIITTDITLNLPFATLNVEPNITLQGCQIQVMVPPPLLLVFFLQVCFLSEECEPRRDNFPNQLLLCNIIRFAF